jgi:hypothetical protein
VETDDRFYRGVLMGHKILEKVCGFLSLWAGLSGGFILLSIVFNKQEPIPTDLLIWVLVYYGVSLLLAYITALLRRK